MDFRTPTQILFGTLLAAMSVSLLGLAANNVAYVGSQRNSPIDVHYTRWDSQQRKPFSYWISLDYLPSRFSMDSMNAMLAVSVIGMVVGVGSAVGAWMMRKEPALATSFSLKKEKRSLPFLPVALIMTTVTFLVTLAVAAYTYHMDSRRSLDFYSWLPVDVTKSEKSTTFSAPFTFTPEAWNCFLAPYAVQANDSRKLRSLCREASVAKYLMIPILLLAAALLGSLAWSWQKNRVAAADASRENAKEVEEISVHTKN